MKSGIISRYWHAYGGWKSLFKSAYFWTAAAISAMLYPNWSAPEWWDTVLDIIPNLLGFSLGGYAMWIAIGDDDFRKLISGEDGDGKPSPYMEVNAAFVHFIVLQMLAMLLALFAKAYYFKLPPDHILITILGGSLKYLCLAGHYFSYLIFIYALLSAIAATFALLRVSSWYDENQTQKNKPDDK